MSIAQQLNEVLGHADLADFLAEQTTAINQAFAQEQISEEERAALLHDLVNTNVVIQGANDQDTRIFIDRVIAVVMSAPLPS